MFDTSPFSYHNIEYYIMVGIKTMIQMQPIIMPAPGSAKPTVNLSLKPAMIKRFPGKSGDMEKVVARLKSEIAKIKELYEALGVKIILDE